MGNKIKRLNDLHPKAKRANGFTDYGIDDAGESVWFGFTLVNGGEVRVAFNWHGLAESIKYLQQIAHQAQQRRISKRPHQAQLEAEAAQSNPIHQIEFLPDVTGAVAELRGTTKQGTKMEPIQIEYDLILRLYQHLPELLDEMQRRQQDALNRH